MADQRLSDLTADTSIAPTDLFYKRGAGGDAFNRSVNGSTLRHFISDSYNVMDYGAVGDGATDDYAAVLAAITAAQLVGGIVYFPAGTYRIDSQIIIPNDGAAVPKQRPIQLYGAGALFSGQTIAPYGGTILDLRYSGSGAKIETRGLGLLQVVGLTLTDFGTSSNAFLKTTNTTLIAHDIAFVGNSTKTGATCDQDAFVLGGTSTASDGSTNAPFQGYGTIIERCYFARIRRGVLFQTYANGVVIRDNTWWNTCGASGTTAAAIEFAGHTSNYCTGNVVSSNLIESVGYAYPIKVAKAVSNTFTANNFYDPSGVTAFYRFEVDGVYNLVIAGYSSDSLPLVSDASGNTNTIINPHQSQTTAFAQPVLFIGGASFPNVVIFNEVITQQAAVSKLSTYVPVRVVRSAAESSNPGTDIFAVQYNGVVTIGGANAGVINFVDQTGAAIAFFTAGMKNFSLAGSGGAMSQNSGSGGSYYTLQNFGIKIKDHTGTEQLRLGAGIDGMLFGSAGDTNLKRTAADVLSTDDRFVAALGLVTSSSVTGSRPASPQQGQMHFDTTLGKPIWRNGANWVDATGATV